MPRGRNRGATTERTLWRRSSGFTLLELMVTLTVVGVVLAFGVPGFFEIIRNNRAATNANELVTTLAIARSEAVRRGARVSVCRSDNGTSCIGSGWNQGWILFVDGAASDTASPVVAQVLRVWPAPTGDTTLTTSGGVTWVRFLPRGEVRSSATLPITYTLQITGCSGQQRRLIELNAVGRTKVVTGACA